MTLLVHSTTTDHVVTRPVYLDYYLKKFKRKGCVLKILNK